MSFSIAEIIVFAFTESYLQMWSRSPLPVKYFEIAVPSPLIHCKAWFTFAVWWFCCDWKKYYLVNLSYLRLRKLKRAKRNWLFSLYPIVLYPFVRVWSKISQVENISHLPNNDSFVWRILPVVAVGRVEGWTGLWVGRGPRGVVTGGRRVVDNRIVTHQVDFSLYQRNSSVCGDFLVLCADSSVEGDTVFILEVFLDEKSARITWCWRYNLCAGILNDVCGAIGSASWWAFSWACVKQSCGYWLQCVIYLVFVSLATFFDGIHYTQENIRYISEIKDHWK